MSNFLLHGYWRSSAAYRVRIALNLKGVRYAQKSHDLRKGDQRADDYLRIAPHGLVPALVAGNEALIESPAILEWIEARWPEPSLLPIKAFEAATVRAMAAIIGCDIHPLNNLRILKTLRDQFNASDEQVTSWVQRWIGEGFAALETLVARHGGRFAFGDHLTLADCYLVPQLYNARRFGVELSPYPRLVAAAAAAERVDAVSMARPELQPDADL